MPSAFSNTPEADALIERIEAIDKRYQAAQRKMRSIEQLTLVLVSCSLMFGGCLALESVLKERAVINQEVSAWKR
ncbi:hypothetical protein AGRHK599_LOCUS1252 [Rhizobium rhizogenes]|uniref:Uncharacterized protein n=1 Tax=Rhizobium rhizogenes TaxID=359 RepID=A0AAN2A1K5_RHIRH|nr:MULTISPECIES: hypothetical protein [Rhizobium/Agrobacterium group]AQS61745.1 hypothetical protein B0909_05405 [Rhizobium rhizogenes]MCZ7443027.1 hypothetical protein [Rhizobium rhizogenes]NSZ79012.1 hypothetical protein [Agrobacterium tumefaciens]OAM65809.1 hypothetical protein A8L48_22720 [Rhizobium rhizogenes]CAD0211226.1 hypothetical protein AGRHK599_LOCUS1252 [Rhizobium rhizogenes]